MFSSSFSSCLKYWSKHITWQNNNYYQYYILQSLWHFKTCHSLQSPFYGKLYSKLYFTTLNEQTWNNSNNNTFFMVILWNSTIQHCSTNGNTPPAKKVSRIINPQLLLPIRVLSTKMTGHETSNCTTFVCTTNWMQQTIPETGTFIVPFGNKFVKICQNGEVRKRLIDMGGWNIPVIQTLPLKIDF